MKLTHFGHSAFRFETGRSVVLVDPFLQGNPHYKGSLQDAIRGATHIALTHGHSDHVGDTIAIAEQTGAKVIGTYELVRWLAGQGVKAIEPANTGGTVVFDDFTVTLTQAFHSSASVSENGQTTYLGMPNGLVFHFSDGPTVYDMGDTDIFGDMALINELHQPKVGLVPIGDRLTMGAAVAALACRRYFQFETVVPIHYGTMPILDQSPDKFREAMESEAAKIRVPTIGEAVEL